MNDNSCGAFPLQTFQNPYNGEMEWGNPGLTKRELFAAMAMQGMLSRDGSMDGEEITEAAVCYADALITALREEG